MTTPENAQWNTTFLCASVAPSSIVASGTNCEFNCDYGFDLSGSSHITCDKGNWSTIGICSRHGLKAICFCASQFSL